MTENIRKATLAAHLLEAFESDDVAKKNIALRRAYEAICKETVIENPKANFSGKFDYIALAVIFMIAVGLFVVGIQME
jgi:hypothetical protein